MQDAGAMAAPTVTGEEGQDSDEEREGGAHHVDWSLR